MRFLFQIVLSVSLLLLLIELILMVISHVLTVREQWGNKQIKKAQKSTILQMHHAYRDISKLLLKRTKRDILNSDTNGEYPEKFAQDLDLYLRMLEKGIQLCDASQKNTDLKPVFPLLEESTRAQKIIASMLDGEE